MTDRSVASGERERDGALKEEKMSPGDSKHDESDLKTVNPPADVH